MNKRRITLEFEKSSWTESEMLWLYKTLPEDATITVSPGMSLGTHLFVHSSKFIENQYSPIIKIGRNQMLSESQVNYYVEGHEDCMLNNRRAIYETGSSDDGITKSQLKQILQHLPEDAKILRLHGPGDYAFTNRLVVQSKTFPITKEAERLPVVKVTFLNDSCIIDDSEINKPKIEKQEFYVCGELTSVLVQEKPKNWQSKHDKLRDKVTKHVHSMYENLALIGESKFKLTYDEKDTSPGIKIWGVSETDTVDFSNKNVANNINKCDNHNMKEYFGLNYSDRYCTKCLYRERT